MVKMFKIRPLFAERIWGGTRLKEKFGFAVDVDPCGEAWLIADIPLGTNWVEEAQMSIHDFYEKYRTTYFGIKESGFPLRATILDPGADLSIQLHPTDEYALKHENSLGKPEAWYVMETVPGGKIYFGHKAQSKAEFIEKANNDQWDELLDYVIAEEEKFLFVDAGVLHAVGKDVICFEVSRSSDVTYRVYDYKRIDQKTGLPRQLHMQQAFDNIKAPANEVGLIKPEEHWDKGVGVIEYHNVPGQFIFRRLRCREQGTYQQREFGFYVVGRGSGIFNGRPVKLGETYFVAQNSGDLQLSGDFDLLMVSFSDKLD